MRAGPGREKRSSQIVLTRLPALRAEVDLVDCRFTRSHNSSFLGETVDRSDHTSFAASALGPPPIGGPLGRAAAEKLAAAQRPMYTGHVVKPISTPLIRRL